MKSVVILGVLISLGGLTFLNYAPREMIKKSQSLPRKVVLELARKANSAQLNTLEIERLRQHFVSHGEAVLEKIDETLKSVEEKQ